MIPLGDERSVAASKSGRRLFLIDRDILILVRNSLAYARYMLLPRAKARVVLARFGFVLIGSVTALCVADFAGFTRWLIICGTYELGINQPKFHINDFFGRISDHFFERRRTSRFPRTFFRARLLLLFVVIRIAGACTVLWVFYGIGLAALGLATIILQLLYEGIKYVVRWKARGLYLLVVASAAYGIRSVVGYAAASTSLGFPVIPLFVWAGCCSAVFLVL